MDEREHRVLQLLRRALDTAPDERESFLSIHCEGDTALRQRVDALLRRCADEAAENAAAHPHDSAHEPVPARDDPLLGTRLGPFRVVECIGRGGMGVVYRGTREGADFRQQVALKLIRRGFDFDDVQARFLRERRILARLDHANLARFVDGGVAPDGRPWFALDYVDGESITRWCDAHRLDLRARVRLFLDVCAAVQYAHAQLVVHRDLKPANILVDLDGRVRLLDFGIAGLLSGNEDGEATLMAASGIRRAMTPEYAAPEQFSGEDAGIATDVYALGVVLFVLLAGVLPYPIERSDADGMQRIVREQLPQALAQAIARSDTSGEPHADDVVQARVAARSTHLRAFRTEVRGDLARIVGKALAKAPADRYATVQAFADDLQRWLAGTPVQVSGNRWRYRAGKFIRRNRIAVTLASAAALVLALGVAGMTWQARAAMRSAERATAIESFVFGLFRAASPLATQQQLPTTEELLAEGARQAANDSSAAPQTQFDMLMTIGRIYLDLRRYDNAMPLLQQALALGEREYGKNDARLLPPLLGILQAETFQLEINNGAPQQASAHLARTQAIARSDTERADVALADCALHETGERDAADVEVCEAAVAALERLGNPDPAKLAKAYYLSARTMDLAGGRAEESIATSRRGLQRVATLHGETRRYDEMSLSAQLSETLASVNRYDEALVEVRNANAIAATIFPRPHPDHGKLLFDEASLLRKMGRERDAESRLRAALSIYVPIHGEHVTPKSADMFWTRLNLSTSLIGQRRYAEADEILRGMLADVDADPDLRKQRRTVAQLHANLALSLVGQHRLDEATAMLAGGLEPFKSTADGTHVGAVPSRVYSLQAKIQRERGHPVEALWLFERAITALGTDPSAAAAIAQVRIDLGTTQRLAGDGNAAIATGTQALDTLHGLFGDRHPGTIRARHQLQQSLRAANRIAEANVQRARVRAALDALEADHPLRVEIEQGGDVD